MRLISLFLATLVLILQCNQIHAQPIKASDDLVYPVNPPRPVHAPITLPDNQHIVASALSANLTASPTSHAFKDQDGFSSSIQRPRTQKQNPTYTVSFESDRFAAIPPDEIQISAFAYSKNTNGELSPFEGKVLPKWTSIPVDFREAEQLSIEIQTEGDEPYGIVVGLYLKGKLMTYTSEPNDLLQQFPLPLKK